ncbi:hypothetical protein HAX54_044158, partial [Datura stramonium]|nr:hypothetical protein [Datura stramonium]
AVLCAANPHFLRVSEYDDDSSRPCSQSCGLAVEGEQTDAIHSPRCEMSFLFGRRFCFL